MEDPYDLSTKQALGYICFSPNDIGDIKKWVKKTVDKMQSFNLDP